MFLSREHVRRAKTLAAGLTKTLLVRSADWDVHATHVHVHCAAYKKRWRCIRFNSSVDSNSMGSWGLEAAAWKRLSFPTLMVDVDLALDQVDRGNQRGSSIHPSNIWYPRLLFQETTSYSWALSKRLLYRESSGKSDTNHIDQNILGVGGSREVDWWWLRYIVWWCKGLPNVKTRCRFYVDLLHFTLWK